MIRDKTTNYWALEHFFYIYVWSLLVFWRNLKEYGYFSIFYYLWLNSLNSYLICFPIDFFIFTKFIRLGFYLPLICVPVSVWFPTNFLDWPIIKIKIKTKRFVWTTPTFTTTLQSENSSIRPTRSKMNNRWFLIEVIKFRFNER
jgi:hypothetical protein